jgi:chemotaxis protein CheD
MMAVTTDSVTTLHPGDVVLGVRGEHLHTLLGSCVAVVLTDPRRTLGVMCHIVHARPALNAHAGSAAHADVALQTMADLLQARGIVASMCDAYVYGGGNMFPHLVPGPGVGDKNVLQVLSTLSVLGIRVLSVDTGGAVYRQLRWTVGPNAPQTVAVPL